MDTLMRYADRAVEHAGDRVNCVIARCTQGTEWQIRFSQNNVDISKVWERLGIEVFVALEGGRTGFGERSVTSEEDVVAAVDSVVAFTERMPQSVFYAGVEQRATRYEASTEDYDNRIEEFGERAPELVNACIDAAIESGATRVAGALKFSRRLSCLRTGHGVEGRAMSTAYDLNVRAFQEQLDWSGQGLACGTVPSAAEEEMLAAGHRAGELAKKAVGAVQGKPGVYDLIMSPTVAANVLGYIPASANPIMVLIGVSPLGDKIGEQIAPEWVSAADDPTVPGGLMRRTFDFEGTPAQRVDIVKDGVLKQFIHNTSTAAMYEVESTGSSEPTALGGQIKMLLPAPSNIVFNNGDTSVEELFYVDRPTIYVTSNWYTRWQDYREGTFSTIPRDAMFLIEGDRWTPIKNLRISDNSLRMFRNIDAMADDRTQVYWWEVDVPTFISTVRVTDCRFTAATQ